MSYEAYKAWALAGSAREQRNERARAREYARLERAREEHAAREERARARGPIDLVSDSSDSEAQADIERNRAQERPLEGEELAAFKAWVRGDLERDERAALVSERERALERARERAREERGLEGEELEAFVKGVDALMAKAWGREKLAQEREAAAAVESPFVQLASRKRRLDE